MMQTLRFPLLALTAAAAFVLPLIALAAARASDVPCWRRWNQARVRPSSPSRISAWACQKPSACRPREARTSPDSPNMRPSSSKGSGVDWDSVMVFPRSSPEGLPDRRGRHRAPY